MVLKWTILTAVAAVGLTLLPMCGAAVGIIGLVLLLAMLKATIEVIGLVKGIEV
jgi:hypothetical protein